MLNIIQKRKIWLSISSVLVVLSIGVLVIWGLKFGIDFTGGSLLEVEFSAGRPANNEVQVAIEDLNLGSLIVQPVGEEGMIIRFQDISEEKHQAVITRLNELVNPENLVQTNKNEDKSKEELKANNEKTEEETGVAVAPEVVNQVTELRFDSVGPTIGNEMKSKSFDAMIIVLVAIILFIAYAFRHVSKPVSSWKYGLSAIIALFHDVIITMGVFAVLGEFYGVEVNTPFVAAILTVLGYSVNDTIVVFDRVRENLPKSEDDFEGTVNVSVNQTIKRSLNTSATTLLVLVSIVLFGGETIRSFVLALAIGVFIGTYSSIFLASPVLVIWEKMKK